MKKFYKICGSFAVMILLAGCSAQSGSGEGEDTSGDTETSQNISIFVDGKEQKGNIKADGETIDTDNIKSSPDIITDTDGVLDCTNGNVAYSETISTSEKTKPKTIDVTMDLTRIGAGNELEQLTGDRINQVKSLLEGNLVDSVELKAGDSVVLRFIGTVDYGYNRRNMPLNDKITIDLEEEKSGKTIKISDIECLKNKRKNIIYLKLKKENITVGDSEESSASSGTGVDIENIKLKINSNQKYTVSTEDEVFDIISKEFNLRYNIKKYSRGTYLLEFLDDSDILNLDQKSVKTFIFSDANFQLHPNFMKNYANPNKINLDEIWDFSPDVYNKNSQKFTSFYRYFTTDPYLSGLKEKCQKNKDLYLVGTKYGANKFFDKFLSEFYKKILPSCNIKFN